MPQIKDAKKFRYHITVLEAHLDTFYHVNNATYLQFLEEARWQMLEDGGFGLETIRNAGIGPVILEIQIRFRRELKLREKIVIESQCKSIEGKITKFSQEIYNEKNELSCSSVFTFAVFDMKTRKIIEPPENWQAALGVTLME